MPKPEHYTFTFHVNHIDTGLNEVITNEPPEFNPMLMWYMCYGLETKDVSSPHWQGYVEWKCKLTYKQMQHIFGGPAKFQRRKGTKEQAIAYCFKELNAQQWGEMQKQGQRTDLDKVREDIKDGVSIKKIADEMPFASYCHTFRALKDYKNMCDEEKLSDEKKEIEVIVLYGGTSTGKSTKAKQLAPKSYPRTCDEPNFDGYSGQESIIMDEFNSQIPITELLSLTSGFPHRLRMRNQGAWSNAKKIVIVSNFHPNQWYPGITDVQRQALYRRISRIIHCTTRYGERIGLPQEELC